MCQLQSYLQPTLILDYNRVKGGINLSDQTIACNTPARKSIKWYQKVLIECISMVVVNSWVLYRRYYNENNRKNLLLGAFTKKVSMSLQGVEEKATVANISEDQFKRT